MEEIPPVAQHKSEGNLQDLSQRNERFFTPQDQEYVKSLFVQYGVTKEPQFDSFESSFNWTEQL